MDRPRGTPSAPLRQDGPHGLRAQKPRFPSSARVAQPVGEDVAALVVGGELYLVDRQKVDVAVHRHGLDRADPIRGRSRHTLLLARHKTDPALADPRRNTVVDFAGE